VNGCVCGARVSECHGDDGVDLAISFGLTGGQTQCSARADGKRRDGTDIDVLLCFDFGQLLLYSGFSLNIVHAIAGTTRHESVE
jgi:hypothetical protein